MFKQQLDVSGVCFVKNDWSILAHNEVDQSSQNRAVFVVILSKTHPSKCQRFRPSYLPSVVTKGRTSLRRVNLLHIYHLREMYKSECKTNDSTHIPST